MTSPAAADPFDALLGASEALEAVREFGRRAAAVDAPVLLTGESGTGKGVLARALHAASARGRAPFVAVNCAGVPETLFETEFFGHARGAFTGAHYAHRGLLEQAHGGTLFLDEIGELPPALQAKLLTVLEDGAVRRVGAERLVRVDFRLIAATAADLAAAVIARRFRLDLYHRLHVLACRLPALRERDDDALLLARHFLALHGRRYGRCIHTLSDGAAARIRAYPWPGNVRQLAHALEAGVLTCDGPVLRARHLSLDAALAVPAAHVHEPAPRTRYSFLGSPADERRHILDVLRRVRGNKTRAAAELGMTRNTLRARLRALGIAPHDAAVRPLTHR